MLQKSLLLFSIGLGLCAFAHAEQVAEQPTIEVTASRVPETVDASLADVSVITRRQIEASSAPDLLELLRLQPGVDIARSGGAGEQTSVFLRGGNSNHVLVLIDGVRVASANTGGFAFEQLPLDAVERVEIVRGPRASFWGSDAIGGVIQIFTRKLTGPLVAASYGSYRSAEGSAGLGQWSDAGGFSVQVGARHVAGFSATNPGICNGPDDPYCIYNPDDNGFHNRNLAAQGAYHLGAQTLTATVFRSQGGLSFDNGDFGVGYSSTLDQAMGANLEGPLSQDWQQRLSVATSREDIDTQAFGTAYRSTREQLTWTNNVALSTTQHLTAGVDFAHEYGVSLDTFGGVPVYSQSRDNSGIFAGWRGESGSLDSELAGRFDDNSVFGNAFSGSAAFGLKLGQAVRVTASYGSAFRAPNLNELFSPGYGGYYAGNPDLDPEKSHTVDVGIDWRPDDANRFDARAFSTRVHDLISFTGGALSQAVNIDRAAIDGVELGHTWRATNWTLDSTLTLQDPRDTDNDSQLLRRPKQKFSSVLQTAVGDRAHAGVEFIYSGKSDDLGGIVLGAYTLVNLRADYQIGADWKLGARLENLFDRDYALVHGYNTPGRSGFINLTWQPH